MSGKTIPPGILHPREPDTCAFAEHEDGHTKMAAFKIPGPTATVFMGVLAGRGDSACSSIAVVPSQASPILKEIARLDALAAQGRTIDDRVYRPRASASLGPSMPTRRSAGTRRSAFGASLVRACDLGEALAMRKEYGRLYNAHAAAAAKAEAAVADGSGSHTGRAGRAPRPKSRYWAPWWARRPRRRLHQPSPPVRS